MRGLTCTQTQFPVANWHHNFQSRSKSGVVAELRLHTHIHIQIHININVISAGLVVHAWKRIKSSRKEVSTCDFVEEGMSFCLVCGVQYFVINGGPWHGISVLCLLLTFTCRWVLLPIQKRLSYLFIFSCSTWCRIKWHLHTRMRHRQG